MFTRRRFVEVLGAGALGTVGAPAFITARGAEALRGEWGAAPSQPGLWSDEIAAGARRVAATAIRLDSNENPNGPGQTALDAVRAAFGESARYPDNPSNELRDALARAHGVSPDSVLLGCGSGDVLRMAALAFTSPSRALVTGAPTFEDPTRYAESVGAWVRAVPVDSALKLDLRAMLARVPGAGLVFLCNPNNPTATVHSADAVKDFVHRARTAEPGAVVLVDEAYHEYVEDPSYATAIPLAMERSEVVVVRTFSKVFGMAGLRIGYALGRPETLERMRRHRLGNPTNVLGAAAALASLTDRAHIDRERTLNREARDFTRRSLESMGFKVGPSETNFVMVDVRRDSRDFQTACREHDILVGRPFPPLTTQARISIGTMDEMRQAMNVFRRVLRTT
ncbi:MAG TPA: aminotransferase class I/II-fold pyridoxal phosphate-dependent enzyme [Gemmatimonadaceae bacterium]|nr:aminotransferase class I/II-fold pyridoxal phosphate-dependent enzyme [Gemmatimonadaceae bacterium]